MKEVKDDTNRWRDTPRSGQEDSTLLPKASYQFNAIPVKPPVVFFTEQEQKFSQFAWKHTYKEKINNLALVLSKKFKLCWLYN